MRALPVVTGVLLAMCVVAAPGIPTAAADPFVPPILFPIDVPMALSLGWHGYADTKIDFASFFAGDHTIMMRFLPRSENGPYGPLVAGNLPGGGYFAFGQADFDDALKATGTHGRNLYLSIGGKIWYYDPLNRAAGSDTQGILPIEAGPVTRREWQHVAIVRKNVGVNAEFRVYVNGALLHWRATDSSTSDRVSLPTASITTPGGQLRLGSSGDGLGPTHLVPAQFYGLIADLAVYTVALSAADVGLSSTKALGGPGTPTVAPYITGGLLKYLNFRASASTLVFGSFVDPANASLAAKIVAISTVGTSANDANKLIGSTHPEKMHLPIADDTIWRVGQGMDANYGPISSHKGMAAYSLDLMFDSPQGASQALSCGPEVVASGPGEVVFVNTSHPDQSDVPPNRVLVRHSAGTNPNNFETLTSYLHVASGSDVAAVGDLVQDDEQLAETGSSGVAGCHIHTGMIPNFTVDGGGDGVTKTTIPMEYSDYYVQRCSILDDHNAVDNHCTAWKSWCIMARGTPQTGDRISRDAPFYGPFQPCT